ncbi:pectinesterase family protein [Paenibacillus algorifonticola]|uniref:pectinesterase family protein n=1 Tax=Paenibacillus algorifonticola TaxID=684063 RepID=UPI003D276A5D
MKAEEEEEDKVVSVVVAADGSGDFTSIQAAVDTVPATNKERVIIYIRNGFYYEKLHIEKPMISLIGESANETIISFDDHATKAFPDGELYHTFYSYTVFVGADDFIGENMTFINTAGPGEKVGQALALYTDGDRACFRNCRLIGHQDTLFTGPLPEVPIDRSFFGGPREGAPRRQSRQYYENCYIEGDVDFIFGSATVLFNYCDIFAKNRGAAEPDVINGWIAAASTPEHAPHGYVFNECRLIGDAPAGSVYLGRPWRNHAKTIFIRCWMGEHIAPAGWDDWNKPEAHPTVHYGEYASTGPGGSSDKRISWSQQLTADQAADYSLTHILAGADGWSPLQRERAME